MPKDSAKWPVLLPCAMLLMADLACGGFQLRSTKTPTPAAMTTPTQAVAPVAAITPATTPTAAPTAAPSATATPAIETGGLAVGKSARVAATGGINVRDKAGLSGKQVGKLNVNQLVSIKAGPVQVDNYTWWQIDNGAGLTGWVSAGPANDPWLRPESGAAAAPAITPAVGGGQLVDRPIKVGDRVQVVTQAGKVLTVREAAGQNAAAVARVLAGTQFTVRSGPEQRDGFTWWQVEGDQVKGWVAEGDGTDRWILAVER